MLKRVIKMVIRDIRESDAAGCLEIYNYYIENSTATFEETILSAEEFLQRIRRISEKYPFIAAEENGRIIGYAYLDVYNQRSAYRYTADLSIYLSNESVSRGIGGRLLSEIESSAEKMEIRSIISIITGENSASLIFHERHGFIRRGQLKNVGLKFGKELDVFFYQKEVKA